MTRFAIYYAPAPGTPLHRFGSAWLGRDAYTNATFPHVASDGLSAARLGEITAEPRRYGTHATLKPPFALAEGRSPQALHAALETFAAARDPFDAAPLELGELGGFLALVPASPSAALARLAGDAVEAFEAFRASPSPFERERRERAALTARQRHLLDRYGYPYVLDEWRFHVTLTAKLDDVERVAVRRAVAARAAELPHEPLRVDALALFVEARPGEPFRAVARFPLGGRA